MFAQLPPDHQEVNPTCIRSSSDGRCFASVQAAWEAYLDKPTQRLPPGYVQVPSVSRPGQFSYFNKQTGEKYATVDLAWRAHMRKSPPVVIPAPVLSVLPEPKGISEDIEENSSSASPTFPVSAIVSTKPFVDAAFPSTDVSIGKCFEEDSTSRLTISLQEKRNIRWMRLPEVIGQLPSVEDPLKTNTEVTLFGTIDIHHLIQGVAGDCWLLATLACLAEFPEQIKALFSQTDGMEAQVSAEGKYKIRIYDLSNTRWETVTIDDTIPCVKSHGRYVPVFARPYGNEMWAVLIEKAMAKFVGSYAAISGGHEAYALIALTGFPQVYQFRREHGPSNGPLLPKEVSGGNVEVASLLSVRNRWVRGWSQYNKRSEPSCGFRPSLDDTVYSNFQLFDKLVEYDGRDYLLAGSITNFREPRTQSGYYRPDGLVLGHAYSVIAVEEVILQDRSIRLVQLRNPHGAGRLAEWKGDWCDDSPLWVKYPEVASKLNHVKSDDGVFWMPFDSFVDIFDRILVLCKPMGLQRDLARASMRRESQLQKAEAGRQMLGVALKKMATYTTMDAIKRMSVDPYDPYLNVPDWIRNDQALLRQWVADKGHHL